MGVEAWATIGLAGVLASITGAFLLIFPATSWFGAKLMMGSIGVVGVVALMMS